MTTPKNFKHPQFGIFKWIPDWEAYMGRIPWGKRKITAIIYQDVLNLSDIESIWQTLVDIVSHTETWDAEIHTALKKYFYTLAEDWFSPHDDYDETDFDRLIADMAEHIGKKTAKRLVLSGKIDEDGFYRLMKLDSISLSEQDLLDFNFDDDGWIFGGHSITLTASIERGILDGSIAG